MANKTQAAYLEDFLNVTPFALALWRSGEAYVLNQLVPYWPEPVLDLGCGFGEFMGVFYEGDIEIGLDINHKDLIQAARTKKYRECKLADARHLPYLPHSVQTIVSVSVLEHILDVDQVFAECHRVLKPGGLLVFTVPTKLINPHLLLPQALSRIGLNRLGDRYIQAFHQTFKHINIWSEKRWLQLVQAQHFQILAIRPTLTLRQLHLFETWLPTALPSQITRSLLGKRWVVDHPWRHQAWQNVIKDACEAQPTLSLNLAVVCQKI